MASFNKKFISYLDNYDSNFNATIENLAIIKGLIQNNYYYNRVYTIDNSPISTMKPPSEKLEPIPETIATRLTSRSGEIPMTSMLISSPRKRTLKIHTDISLNYDSWMHNHEVKLNTPKEKEKRTIETNVSSIEDLLKIIEENEYNNRYEYNIDLKGLHNIKEELYSLQKMIGMSELKTTIIHQLLYFIQRLHISSTGSDFKHTVIYGPPGTGKTEVAKIIGKMYSKLGILEKSVFKKVTRSDLIAGYLGQTAIKTNNVIKDCLGGVLFIDEAYSLADSDTKSSDSYSKECIDTLCEALSDHKDKLMVIIAGYKKELNETFFRVNKGMDSRFIWRFTIDSYDYKELMNIFVKLMDQNDWCWHDNDNDNELEKLSWFERNKDSFVFFGRDMESLFTYVKISHGKRIYGKEEEYKKKITMEDLDAGYSIFLKNKEIQPAKPFGLQMMYM
jgi:SpoVK/Ycf46/Vps4 family AAA+-type ATPase